MTQNRILETLHDVATGKLAGGYPERPTVGVLAFNQLSDGGAVCEQFDGQRWVENCRVVPPGAILEV